MTQTIQLDATPAAALPAAGQQLLERINQNTAVVGVVGMGYVGLPLAKAFINGGLRVLGFDVDAKKIEQLRAGQSYIGHIPSEWIADCVKQDKLDVTADAARLAEADVILICVPTPLSDSRGPDLSYIEATAAAIVPHLRSGHLVTLESTTYPGTTRDVLLPILAQSELECGRDFFLAYSPEREDPGNAQFSAGDIPKVVGGIDDASRELALALYNKAIANVVPASSCEVAEACKILENTYRCVNIAMVNELKILFDTLGIDIWEVIEAAKTKPFGFQAFYPGPGLGGHCIPIDPFYLSWLARKYDSQARFIELAGEINTSMPAYVVNRITEALNQQGKPIRGSRIGILGVAYKKDIDDPRESPAFKLFELLQARGAVLSYVDPHIPVLPSMRSFAVPKLASEELSADYLASLDCAVIVTDHTAFDYELIVKHARLVVDTRNATKDVAVGRDNVVKA